MNQESIDEVVDYIRGVMVKRFSEHTLHKIVITITATGDGNELEVDISGEAGGKPLEGVS